MLKWFADNWATQPLVITSGGANLGRRGNVRVSSLSAGVTGKIAQKQHFLMAAWRQNLPACYCSGRDVTFVHGRQIRATRGRARER